MIQHPGLVVPQPHPRRHFEKSPFTSKKFIAFLVAEVSWKIVFIIMIFTMTNGMAKALMLATVIIVGFIEVTFIGGQAALDKYVRVAEITMHGQQNVVPHGTGVQVGGDLLPPEFDEPPGEGPLDPKPKEGDPDA